jgi:hypothetical protein
MLALIFYKPAAAAVYATAFTLIGAGRGVRVILMGFVMVILSILAMPVLMRFFTWGTGQITDSSGGGGFLQTALSGAVAIGALRGFSSGPGGSAATDQARLVSAQLGPPGSGPSGTQAGGAAAGRPPAAPPGGAMPAHSTSAAAATGAAAAAGGPAGFAAAGLAAGAGTARRKATEAMQPPAEAGPGQ